MIEKYFILMLITFSANVFANGLLMPTSENYPKDFLRNTVSHVTVNFYGTIAETKVYQEFLHEGFDSTDAVYSFPLPKNAKATKFIYWYKDKIYQAVLKVKEQDNNPGTGEGGIAALVNDYIGSNGIKVKLKGIQPGKIQKVELCYISSCEYYKGEHSYKFPLNTSKFTKYQLDNIEFNINIENSSSLISYNSPTHTNIKELQKTDNSIKLKYVEPKGFLSKDFIFNFNTEQNDLGIDFYSINNDSTGGHFYLSIKPELNTNVDSSYSKRIIFLLSTSAQMYGAPLTQSIKAIKSVLEKLSVHDQFNIVTFNYSTHIWQSQPVAATSNHIESAKNYLDNISYSDGANMDNALRETLALINDNEYSNSILLFSGGYSYSRPKAIAEINNYKVGIFPIAIGEEINPASLEMTAALNYGFVTYIERGDNIYDKINKVYDKISVPILQDVALEFGNADITELLPIKAPSTYSGTNFYTVGKYSNPGESAFSIAGTSITGQKAYNFTLPFTDSSNQQTFVEKLWAKKMIDALEWEIELYGETTELKEKLIEISLTYNIRCRYTAYLADYENEYDGGATNITDEVIIPVTTHLEQNYPNPFNPSTTIRFYIDQSYAGKTALIKIYNILGELVAVLDLNNISSGWQKVVFNGKDIYGNSLPTGIYIAQLQIGNEIKNSIKMTLLK